MPGDSKGPFDFSSVMLARARRKLAAIVTTMSSSRVIGFRVNAPDLRFAIGLELRFLSEQQEEQAAQGKSCSDPLFPTRFSSDTPDAGQGPGSSAAFQ